MKSTTCSLDIIPTTFPKEVTDTGEPSVLLSINSSLVKGILPILFKHAVVQPLLKKPNLDPSVLLGQYLNLHFYQKVLERQPMTSFKQPTGGRVQF